MKAPTAPVAGVTGSTPPFATVTYSTWPSGAVAIPAGDVPSGTVRTTASVEASTMDSELLPVLPTDTVRPSGLNARTNGAAPTVTWRSKVTAAKTDHCVIDPY